MVYFPSGMQYEVCMSPGSSLSISKSLDSLESSHLLCVSRVSSKESKRTSLIPDWSQWYISHQECSMNVSRKLCIDFEVSSFLGKYLNSPLQLKTVLFLANRWVTLASDWSNFDGVKDDLSGVRFFWTREV